MELIGAGVAIGLKLAGVLMWDWGQTLLFAVLYIVVELSTKELSQRLQKDSGR